MDLAVDAPTLRPLTFSIAYRMLGSVTEAEDVVQAGLLRMHERARAGDDIERPDAFGPGAHQVGTDGTLLAPMPGTILSVSAAPGQPVEAGAVLGVMEAMKMELSLKAPVDGTVAAVAVKTGETIDG